MGKRDEIKQGRWWQLSEREPIARARKLPRMILWMRLPAGSCNACIYKTLPSSVILLPFSLSFFRQIAHFLNPQHSILNFHAIPLRYQIRNPPLLSIYEIYLTIAGRNVFPRPPTQRHIEITEGSFEFTSCHCLQ